MRTQHTVNSQVNTIDVLRDKIEDYEENISKLQLAVDNIRNEFNELQDDYDSLYLYFKLYQIAADNIQNEYNELQGDYDSLYFYFNLYQNKLDSILNKDKLITEYIKLEAICQELSEIEISDYYGLEDGSETGLTVRFHDNGRIAVFTIGVTGCGDCYEFYRFYFNDEGRLIRQKHSAGCAFEGMGTPQNGYVSETYIDSEWWEDFPEIIRIGFNSKYVEPSADLRLNEFKDGEIPGHWKKLNASEIKDNFAFDCMNL